MKPKTKTQKLKTKNLTKFQTIEITNQQLRFQLSEAQEDITYINRELKNLRLILGERGIEIVKLNEQNSNLIEAISVLGRNIRLQNQGERFKEESNGYQVTIEKPKENSWQIQKEDKNL